MCSSDLPVSARTSWTVSKVSVRVLPPAPNVTEKNFGTKAASLVRVEASLATPSAVRGGKNSKLKLTDFAGDVVMVRTMFGTGSYCRRSLAAAIGTALRLSLSSA